MNSITLRQAPSVPLRNALLSKFDSYPAKAIRLEISKLLGITEMSVYNKLSGRSEFTLNEFILLAQELNISLDKLILKQPDHSLSFNSDVLLSNVKKLEDYLINTYSYIRDNLKSPILRIAHVSSQPHPLHFLEFPHLLYFKLYSYHLINWQCRKVEKYDPIAFMSTKSIRLLIDKYNYIINKIPQKIIINTNYLSKLRIQIQQLFRSGYIEDIYLRKKIINELEMYVTSLKSRIQHGGRMLRNDSFVSDEIYINDFVQVGDIVLYEASERSLVTVLCDAPHVIGTNNPTYTSHISKWFDNVQDFSIKISKGGKSFRKQFFDNIDESLNSLNNDLGAF